MGRIATALARLALVTLLSACAPDRPPVVVPQTTCAAKALPDSVVAMDSIGLRRTSGDSYVASVKPGNQRVLNTAAAMPFAIYVNGMHNRIHPIFADGFLASLHGLPGAHPMNDTKLVVRVEVVVSKDGHVAKMGIVHGSGVAELDASAIDAVNRAQPFGPPPAPILSADGNVYLHWEFHRDEVSACSTMNARPFLLTAASP